MLRYFQPINLGGSLRKEGLCLLKCLKNWVSARFAERKSQSAVWTADAAWFALLNNTKPKKKMSAATNARNFTPAAILDRPKLKEGEKMPKMLLVHPYYGLMKFWIQLLREKGFEVVFADNLADTLKRLKAEKFDLLVIEPLLGPGQEGFPLDEKFSNYPGLEAMRQIRANAFAPANPESLPIVVWTTMIDALYH